MLSSNLERSVRADPNANIVAGGVGGFCSFVVGHPFDTVKVRLQTAPAGQARPKAWTVARVIVQNEGVLALYRGMGGILYMAVPRSALIFYGNSWGKKLYGGDDDVSLARITFGGLFSQLLLVPCLVTPLERVKTLLQTDHARLYSGQIDCARHVVSQHGITSLFKGVLLTYARDMPGFITYFLTYESLRTHLSKTASENNSPVASWRTLLAGGISGVLAWAVALPMDTAKNRFQAKLLPGSAIEAIMSLYRVEGLKGFFRGFGPLLLRAFPANAAAFWGYETTLAVITRRKEKTLQRVNCNIH